MQLGANFIINFYFKIFWLFKLKEVFQMSDFTFFIYRNNLALLSHTEYKKMVSSYEKKNVENVTFRETSNHTLVACGYANRFIFNII